MAMEQRWFWVGVGQPRIDGEPVRHGEEIDPKKVHPATWDVWVKEGSVSNANLPVKIKEKDPKAEAALRDKLKEAEAENKRLATALEKARTGKKADRIKELEARVAELEADVAEKAALIEKLNADPEAATAPEIVGDQS